MNGFKVIQNTPSIVWLNEFYIEDRIDANNYNSLFLDIKDKIFQINNNNVRFRNIVKNINNGIEARDYSEQGRPYLRVSDLKEFNIDYNNICRININYNDIPEKAKVQIGDLLISRSGTIGIAKAVKEEDLGIVISSHIINVSIDTSKVDIDYLSTFINSRYGKLMIEQLSNGGVIKEISHDRLLSLIIPIPSSEIQKYIGDKIRKAEELREEAKRLKKEAEKMLESELELEKIKHYVEKMSQKKYSWVKNEQLEDRIDGNFYKSKYNYLDELNNLSRLEKFYKITKKRINRNLKGQIKYIDLSSVNSIIEPNEYNINDLPSRAQFLVENGDLIVSTLKGSNKISIIPKHLKDSVCSTGFVVINSKSYLTTEYLYLIFTNKLFNMQIERYSTGSIMNAVNHDDFNKMYIPVISDKQMVSDITYKISQHFKLLYQSKQLIQEAKQDVEDLIEGNFDMSKVKANN